MKDYSIRFGGSQEGSGRATSLPIFCAILVSIILATSFIGVSGSALQEGIPSPPRDLTSSPGDGYITLEWLAPESQGGSPIYAYEIYRGLSPDQMATMGTIGNTTSYNDNSVENGVTYHYKVRARNDQGWSEFSSLTNATPYGTPSAPTTLEATVSGGQVELDWTAPDDDGGKPIENYRIYRRNSTSQMALLTTIGNVTHYKDGTVSEDGTYMYRVSAVNDEGEGQYSSTVQVLLGGESVDLMMIIVALAVVAIALVGIAFFVRRRG